MLVQNGGPSVVLLVTCIYTTISRLRRVLAVVSWVNLVEGLRRNEAQQAWREVNIPRSQIPRLPSNSTA